MFIKDALDSYLMPTILQDLEAYKQTVKEEITEWQAALKAKSIPDWLIIVVNSEENKMKTKLLPRSSVYDKIKSDFCSKHQERYKTQRKLMVVEANKKYTLVFML